MNFDAIHTAIDAASDILVLGHIRPDGDALGSCLAFALYLEKIGKRVSVWNDDACPEKFIYLPQFQKISQPPAGKQSFDLVIALDASTQDRLGDSLNHVAGTPPLINIDHHPSNEKFGDIHCIVPTAPATGQIVYNYLAHVKFPLDKEMATNLFVAISTDTGSFQYLGTNAETFRIAAALTQAGVDVPALSIDMYASYPVRRFNLLRHVLSKTQFFCDGKIAAVSLTLGEVFQLGTQPEDTEGIIDALRAIREVVCAVFFEELDGDKVRISARSKSLALDISAVCAQFGGGGHTLAAGARACGSIDAVVAKFIEIVTQALSPNNS